MTKAPECIWGIFDQFGHGSTMLRDLSQNNNILTAGGNEPTKFVRADLYEAQTAEIERLMKERDAFEAKLAKTRLALDYFLLRDPDKPSSWEYTRDRAERLACATLAELTGAKKDGH